MFQLLIIGLFSVTLCGDLKTDPLPKKWHGTWVGQMKFFPGMPEAVKNSAASGKVAVQFEIEEITNSNALVWRMTIGSDSNRVVKDYKLVPTGKPNEFLIDENGIDLNAYHYGDIIYSQFSFEEMVLIARYELKEDQLLFEVTTGIPIGEKQLDGKIQTWKISAVQSVLMKRRTLDRREGE
ncbi:MAG: hypothetical protein AAF939_12500 [Planctomycetota bacterium]